MFDPNFDPLEILDNHATAINNTRKVLDSLCSSMEAYQTENQHLRKHIQDLNTRILELEKNAIKRTTEDDRERR